MTNTITPTMTYTATPTITQTPLPVDLPQPTNNTVKVLDINKYYIGQIIVFPDGSLYIITDIVPDDTSGFDAFLNKIIIEGNSNSGTLILRPIKVVTPTQTGTPSITPFTTPSITPSITQSMTPTSLNKAVTCLEKQSTSNDSSILYLYDCFGYRVLNAYFENGKTLVLQLDTDDTTVLSPGYYKLTI